MGQVGDVRFFMDRGMGAHIVANGLRDRGWSVTTMNERYGSEVGEGLADTQWIEDATRAGEVCLCKDERIARVAIEAQTVYMNDAQVFTLSKASLPGPTMLEWLLSNESAIHRLADTSGPYVFAVGAQRIRRLKLGYP